MKQERANTYLCAAHLDFPGNETEKEYKLEKRVWSNNKNHSQNNGY
jgi:hypothetical protein